MNYARRSADRASSFDFSVRSPVNTFLKPFSVWLRRGSPLTRDTFLNSVPPDEIGKREGLIASCKGGAFVGGALVLCLIGFLMTVGCTATHSGAERHFIVAQVGVGLTTNCAGELPEDSCAVYRGIVQALKAERTADLSRVVRIVPVDETRELLYIDENYNPKYAEISATASQGFSFTKAIEANAITDALRLQADPRVLAIIGHSASSTTRVASPYYAQVGMPLLITIATSPLTSQPRLRPKWRQALLPDKSIDEPNLNFVRLVPNDKLMQAPVVVKIAISLLKAQRLFLLSDQTENPDYAQGMYTEVSRLLSVAQPEKTLNKLSLPGTTMDTVFSKLNSVKPDVIIFCGTSLTAGAFLRVFGSRYKHSDPITVILTDGAKDLGLARNERPNKLRILATFPAPPLSQSSCHQSNSSECELLLSAKSPTKSESYEVYGFDAVLLLGTAFHNLWTRHQLISRASLSRELGDIPWFEGPTFSYLLHSGENLTPQYSVYSSDALSSASVKNCDNDSVFGEAPAVTDMGAQGSLELGYACTIRFGTIGTL